MSIFYLPNLPSKIGLNKCFFTQQLEVRCGQRRLWRHWKLLGTKVLIKHFKESGLAPETMLRTQRSRQFPKPENWLILCILAKGGPQENFLENFNFTKPESYIFYVKWGADEDGVMEKWLWLLFVELWTYLSPIIYPPKWAWKSAFYRNNWNAAAGKRPMCRHWKLLGMKVLIKHFKESGCTPETMLRRQCSRPFPKLEKWLIFGI